ncbi:MAG TPA: hypothetical protein VFA09_22575 [Ktedonobacteraceae bacterium]|nr:hypothetical protein [Ktedonobacteraceae bacterium]
MSQHIQDVPQHNQRAQISDATAAIQERQLHLNQNITPGEM